jgi:hypothetical protein
VAFVWYPAALLLRKHSLGGYGRRFSLRFGVLSRAFVVQIEKHYLDNKVSEIFVFSKSADLNLNSADGWLGLLVDRPSISLEILVRNYKQLDTRFNFN